MASRIKGITIEIGGDVTGLDKALKSVDDNIRDTNARLKDLDKLLKLDPENVVLLAQKQKLLAQQAETTADKLESLKEVSDSVTVDDAQYKKWESTLSSLQGQITKTSDKLRTAKDDLENWTPGTDQYDEAQREIKETESKLEALQKKVKDTYEEMGRPISTKAYDALQREISSTVIDMRKLSDEAEDTDKKVSQINEGPLQRVRREAREAAENLDDAADSAFDFGDALTAGAIVEGIKGIAEGVADLAESTKEYRKIMGTLEVSSQQAGYTAEETKEAYNKLFGVLGDEQATATTVSNLQALQLPQEDLLQLIDMTTGAWAKYGDSIPIDGLAESINETIRTGQVTGTLADVLNWGTQEGETFGVMLKDNIEFTKLSEKELSALTETQREEYEARKAQAEAIEDWNDKVNDAASAEDYLNLALEEGGDQADRTKLLMQALADQGLGSLSDAWMEANEDIVKANESQAEFTEKTAEMAERLAPLMQAVSEGTNDLLDVLLELTENIDMDGAAETIGNLFTVVSDLITFLVDNHEVILSILAGVAAGLAALNIATFIQELATGSTIIQALMGAFPGLAGAISLLTNPIFIVTAAVVALVAYIATSGDEIQAKLQQLDDWLQGVFVTDWTTVFGPVLGEILNGFFANLKNVWDSIKLIFDGIIDFIRGVFTGDWERVWSGIVQIFGGIFSGLVAMVQAPINGVIGLLNAAVNSINMLIGGLNGIGFSLPSWLGGGSFSINIPSIPNIPYLAKGGTLFEGSAIVGEAGPELLTVGNGRAVVQPLPGNTGRIESLLGDISGQLGGGTQTPILVQVTLDGKVIGETALNYSRGRARANGN